MSNETAFKIPGPEFGLNEIMDAFTQTESDYKFNPLRPSSAGKCERELGYELMEFRGHAKYEKESMPAATKRLLDFGDKVEWHANDHLYKAFARMPKPPLIKYKQHTLSFLKFPDGTFLEGKLDLCIEINGELIVCDWKSKGDKHSQAYKTSWDEFPEKLVSTGHATSFGKDAVFITDLAAFLNQSNDPFFANNLCQLNFYACSDFLRERGCKLASILQYNKNDSRIREIRFEPSKAVYEQTKEKFLRVHAAIETDKSVEGLKQEFVLGSMKCGFCQFKKECWPENDALKKYFETLPPKSWPKDLDRLPRDVQDKLKPLFERYHELPDAEKEIEAVEQQICLVLNEAKVFKIRLNPDLIYRMKKLKSGGAAGGERLVIRRDKL